MNALESSIVNQTSLQDAVKLTVPIHMIYGRLDPVVLLKNLHYLEKEHTATTLQTVLASHEVRGKAFVTAVIRAIQQAVKND